MAEILHILGWIWAAAALWLLAAPDSYRRIARGFLDVFESADEAIVRMIGLVAVAIGSAFVHFGIYVV
jgi:uncharacterized protein YjeT (DUF2065 family)